MNKEKIFNHFAAILDNMIDNSLFWDTYFQMPSSIPNIYGSDIDDESIPSNISIRFGISRGCIIDNEYDYVVKFDVETDSSGDSICEREVDLYASAREYGVEKYLVHPSYIGTYIKTITFYDAKKMEHYIDWLEYDPVGFDEDFMEREEKFGELKRITIEVPLYAYERAYGYNFTMLVDSEEERCHSIAEASCSPLRKRSLQVAMEFIHRYGVEEYEKFGVFLEDNNVNDLHPGNVGELNNEFVLIDFAGFHDAWSDEE